MTRLCTCQSQRSQWASINAGWASKAQQRRPLSSWTACVEMSNALRSIARNLSDLTFIAVTYAVSDSTLSYSFDQFDSEVTNFSVSIRRCESNCPCTIAIGNEIKV